MRGRRARETIAIGPTSPFLPASVDPREQPMLRKEKLRQLENDPLVLNVASLDALHGLAQLMDAAAATPSRLTTPLLFLYDINDVVVPKEPILDAIERLLAPPAGRWRVAIYKNGYHPLFRDKQATLALNDTATWVADPTHRSFRRPDNIEGTRCRAAAENWRFPALQIVCRVRLRERSVASEKNHRNCED
jgi:hypothetical protein